MTCQKKPIYLHSHISGYTLKSHTLSEDKVQKLSLGQCPYLKVSNMYHLGTDMWYKYVLLGYRTSYSFCKKILRV